MDDVFLYFEDTKNPQNPAFIFRHPIAEIKAESQEQVVPALEQVEAWRLKGCYVAGYLAYEAGYALIDKKITTTQNSPIPLVHFFVFQQKELVNFTELPEFQKSKIQNVAAFDFKESLSYSEYSQALGKLKGYFAAGDSYQTNFSLRQRFRSTGSAFDLYTALRELQKVSYGAFFNLPQIRLLSFSPELFIKKVGSVITAKPMKGTTARSPHKHIDEENKKFLREDKKSLAENLMIVDLLRNDLGRIAKPGSVRVENLFEIESYKTLHQMITTIHAEVEKDISLIQVMKSLFPCGSITGAPKVRTMEIIAELEREARGVYTGSMGYITPENDFHFNVAIRTLTENAPNEYLLGLGGGVLIDSAAEAEFEECLLKGQFIKRLNLHFEIFETFLFDGQEIAHLEEHLARIEKSCQFFGFKFNKREILIQLDELIEEHSPQLKKVRLSLNQAGEITLHTEDLGEPQTQPKIVISSKATDSRDIFYKHKTTERQIYNDEYEKARALGFYDVIFVNERNELTEGSRHNLFIKTQGQWFTPPLDSGILSGVQRSLTIQKLSVQEKVLKKIDFEKAEEILLTNSVRGEVVVTYSGGVV